MTLAEFITARGKFKHQYLRNECFDRLGCDGEVLVSVHGLLERASRLSDVSLLHIVEATNFRRAAHSWLRGSGEFPAAATQIDWFWTHAAQLEHYTPGPAFPDQHQVHSWAIACDREMQAIEEILVGGQAAKSRLLRFWQYGLIIVDWLAAFSNDHPKFWQMLQRPPAKEWGER